MERRKAVGAAIFALSVAGFVVYAYLLMLSEWSPVVLQLSVLMAVGGILGVVSWIGYTMVTTRPTSASVYPDTGPAFWLPPRPPFAPPAGAPADRAGGAAQPPPGPSAPPDAGPSRGGLDAAGRPSDGSPARESGGGAGGGAGGGGGSRKD